MNLILTVLALQGFVWSIRAYRERTFNRGNLTLAAGLIVVEFSFYVVAISLVANELEFDNVTSVSGFASALVQPVTIAYGVGTGLGLYLGGTVERYLKRKNATVSLHIETDVDWVASQLRRRGYEINEFEADGKGARNLIFVVVPERNLGSIEDIVHEYDEDATVTALEPTNSPEAQEV